MYEGVIAKVLRGVDIKVTRCRFQLIERDDIKLKGVVSNLLK